MLPTCILSCHSYKRGEIKGMRVAWQEGCSLSTGAGQNILVNWCGQWFLPGSYHGIISDHKVSAGAAAFFETSYSPAVTSIYSKGQGPINRFILPIDVAVLVGRWNVLRKFRSRSFRIPADVMTRLRPPRSTVRTKRSGTDVCADNFYKILLK